MTRDERIKKDAEFLDTHETKWWNPLHRTRMKRHHKDLLDWFTENYPGMTIEDFIQKKLEEAGNLQ